jgi:hypothetical protein
MKPVNLALCILLLALLSVPCSAQESTTPKAVVLDLAITGGTTEVIGNRVVNNYPPDNRASRAIVIRMLDGKGTLLLEQGIDDPRIVYLEEGAAVLDTVKFSVIVPFRRDLATIRLLNGTSGAEMVSADVSGTVNGYCKVHGDDPDCATAGISPVLMGAGVILLLVFACAGWLLFRKKGASNQGK